MSNILDTILNVTAFAFIGVLIWLYFKKPPPRDRRERNDSERDAGP